jgi:ribosome-binding factor A
VEIIDVSRRMERIASLIREIIGAAILTRLSDPRIETLTSITRVEVSPDLGTCDIRVSVMATEARQKLTLIALQHAAGRLRGMIAEQLSMRQVPWLKFHLDQSLQKGLETIAAIDRVMAESRAAEATADADADYDPDGPAAADDAPPSDAATDTDSQAEER